MEPLIVYVNWTAYDELADRIELTEELAMHQFEELLRWRAGGVRIDAYIMDAFWFDVDSGYRAWRRPHWPAGPEPWLAACRQHGVTPGLWFSTNTLCHMNPVARWEDSLNRQRTAMCMFGGGFMLDFLDVLQHWYDRGIRIFKFDFAKFDAATPDTERALLPQEIWAANHAALRTALGRFRKRNPDAVLMAFNGFGGLQGNTSLPFRRTVDVRLLDVFDTLYSGDPIPADLPMMNFWRAVDVFSDHMTRHYELNGLPLERIDDAAFVIGDTATTYHRRIAGWKGMLLLSHARGGLIRTYYGDLGLLDDGQLKWLAKAQKLFLDLRTGGRFRMCGGNPGGGEPYGYVARDGRGTVYTVVNPGQCVAAVPLPAAGAQPAAAGDRRLLFADRGFSPRLAGDAVTLGPEQMCVIGGGAYADAAWDLGIQEDVVIPTAIEPLSAPFTVDGQNCIVSEVPAPAGRDLRVTMIQMKDGVAYRSSGGKPPETRLMSEILQITAEQQGAPVPVETRHDRWLWSGLSWCAGEIRASELRPGQPARIMCRSAEAQPLDLTGHVYAVRYAEPRGRRP